VVLSVLSFVSPFLGRGVAKVATVLVTIAGKCLFYCFDGAKISCNPCRELFVVFLCGFVVSGSGYAFQQADLLVVGASCFFLPVWLHFSGGLESCCRLLFLFRPFSVEAPIFFG
jgi:hypothetical protein